MKVTRLKSLNLKTSNLEDTLSVISNVTAAQMMAAVTQVCHNKQVSYLHDD